ncbi:MAG: urease accessory protein UreF [Thermomicrobiales bacterium]
MTATTGHDDVLAFLSSLQLADSLFPSGLYTLSHGLEAFAQAGQVQPGALAGLLTDYLRYGVGPADGVALACAHRAATAGDLDLAARADTRLTAVKLAREVREASLRTGRQLLTLAGQLFGGDDLAAYAVRVRHGAAPGNQAVVLGLALATLGVPRERAVAGELYAFAASCVGASVRLGALDHRVAQAVLHQLKPVIAETAHAAQDQDVADIGGCVPLVDIMTMRHEQADVRLFMS